MELKKEEIDYVLALIARNEEDGWTQGDVTAHWNKVETLKTTLEFLRSQL